MEREVQHEPQVIEGEDELPRQPADRLSYTPEPGPTLGTRRAWNALWLALLVVVAVIAIVVVAALR